MTKKPLKPIAEQSKNAQAAEIHLKMLSRKRGILFYYFLSEHISQFEDMKGAEQINQFLNLCQEHELDDLEADVLGRYYLQGLELKFIAETLWGRVSTAGVVTRLVEAERKIGFTDWVDEIFFEQFTEMIQELAPKKE